VIVHAAPWVLPIAGPPLRDAAVAVDEDGRVAAVGPRSTVAPLGPQTGGHVVEHGGVLMPGVINAHLHLELSHLRVPGGDGLVPWIRGLLRARAGEASSSATARTAARAAARRMAERGTVAAIDHANEDGTAALLADAGVRPRVLLERIARGELPPRPQGDGPPETAHATYSCGAAALRQIAALADGRIPSIHVEEDPAEAAWLVDGAGPFGAFLRERAEERRRLGGATASDATTSVVPGRRPVAWLDDLGVLGEGTLLVHLTVADAESLERAAERGCIAVLCPRSNLHIGGRLPPVEGIRAAGLRAALGTDSLASCPTLDVFSDVQTLARAGVAPAWLLRAATAGATAAFGALDLGSLAVGKRPGVIEVGDDARGLADPEAFVAWEAADAPVRRIA
jgi:cytosine/adenosine deaminase-related metal-dependent hydrolase